MGSEAEKIFRSFEFEDEDDKKDFEVVMKKFDDYFIPPRNIIHERACFTNGASNQGKRQRCTSGHYMNWESTVNSELRGMNGE